MLSPPQSSLGNIMVACRSLQSLVATPVAEAPRPSLASLPTPPMAHAPMPPKLRLRTPRPASPSGPNKRRRADDADHLSHGEEQDADSDLDIAPSHLSDDGPATPSTPKCSRIAPEQLPLGLARADFHDMHLLNNGQDVDNDGAEWSADDDRILVELVLDKLRLSKTEWQDCARSLGKDRHSVGRRWKSLMAKGDVGLKARGPSRRARLHGTWR
ncbi:MYB-like protein [Hirsutella rhossiliensis]|uniref:MYB-like protein n=1 Tax=Hirsutella rhossiliensis TaxID=111463 RepID=A0A9P8SDH1_9HYPO|nr:MYB-like protein [Hirsutella rhossiliensis]KAH0957335.1 MYB-like protein [Hirsutella rhossiliensis]